jgi:hypothetical protein
MRHGSQPGPLLFLRQGKETRLCESGQKDLNQRNLSIFL